MESDTDARRMERLRGLMSLGAFKPVIDSVYPFARAGEAFERQQNSGKHGKILVNFS